MGRSICAFRTIEDEACYKLCSACSRGDFTDFSTHEKLEHLKGSPCSRLALNPTRQDCPSGASNSLAQRFPTKTAKKGGTQLTLTLINAQVTVITGPLITSCFVAFVSIVIATTTPEFALQQSVSLFSQTASGTSVTLEQLQPMSHQTRGLLLPTRRSPVASAAGISFSLLHKWV